MPETPRADEKANPRALTRVTPDGRLWACTHDGWIIIGCLMGVCSPADFPEHGANDPSATAGSVQRAAEGDRSDAVGEDR